MAVRNQRITWMGSAVLIVAAAILVGSCGKSAKIPVSTVSEGALRDYRKGLELFNRLRAQESIAYFQKAIAADSNFAMAYLNLSLVTPSAKGFFENLNKAVALADAVSEGEKCWILGLQAGANGFPVKQGEYYQKLVELYPEDEQAQNLLGNYYFGLQEYGKAVACYQKAIGINPSFSQSYNQMGYAYRFQENFQEAEKAFQKYIQLIPDDPNPYDSHAELLMKMGRFDESIASYRKALAVDSHFVASHTGIASNLNFMGRYREARQQLDRLFQGARNDGERRAAHFAMAVSYADEGNLANALVSQKKVFAIAERIGDAAAMSGDCIVMGNILLEQGKPDAAAAQFEKALQIVKRSNLSDGVKNNAGQNYHYNIGRVLVKKKQLAAAKGHATACLEAAEGIRNTFQIRLAHELLGMIAFEEKAYNRAVQEFEQSNVQNPYNLYREAEAAAGQGNREKAEALYEKAARFNGVTNLNYAFIRKKAAADL